MANTRCVPSSDATATSVGPARGCVDAVSTRGSEGQMGPVIAVSGYGDEDVCYHR